MSDLWEGRSSLQEIYPRIYITNYFGAKNRNKLKKYNISHIINATNELPCPFENEISYKQIPLADNTNVNISNYFNDINNWINNILEENKSNNILIHCAAGSSRSGTIAISYLLSKQEKEERNLSKTIEEITKIRPIILPNPGFIEQLEAYYIK